MKTLGFVPQAQAQAQPTRAQHLQPIEERITTEMVTTAEGRSLIIVRASLARIQIPGII